MIKFKSLCYIIVCYLISGCSNYVRSDADYKKAQPAKSIWTKNKQPKELNQDFTIP